MTPESINQNLFPFGKLMGIEVTAVASDEVCAQMPVKAELCTSGELLHGGAIMAFADSLGAIATYVNLPEGAKGTTTIESKTNFTAAIPKGQMAIATCTSIHRGRTTQVWETRITREDGKLAAVVTQTQLVREAKPSP